MRRRMVVVLICGGRPAPSMESVPGAVATGSRLIATIEIAGTLTRSLPLPVLTSSSNQHTTRRI